MNSTTVVIIVGMALVTYIPRLLPGLLFEHYHMPERFKRWLQNIPYAALGALIFPGIIHTENPLLGIIGGVTAVVLSLFDLHLVIVMTVTIFVAFVASHLL